MNNYKKTNYPVKRIFILDELAIILALITALVSRFNGNMDLIIRSYEGLYITLLVTLCLVHVMVFLVFDARKDHVFVMDPVENFTVVVKSRFILMAISLLYLYIVQKSVLTSRFVLGAFFVISIVYDYIFRMAYRKYHIKKYGLAGNRKTLVIEPPFNTLEAVLTTYRAGLYDDVLIKGGDADDAEASHLISGLEDQGIRTYIALSRDDYYVRSGIVTDIDRYASIPAAVRSERFQVFGVKYAIARTEEAVYHVMKHIKSLAGRYICFSNVHTLVMAKESKEYAEVLNGAAFTFCDGNPIAMLERKQGYIGADRVAGPDFMEHMFRDTMDGKISHYFYGSSQETLDALRENLLQKYPDIDIRGMYSPPFRALSPEEDQADVDMINASGADIIWIGLGAPKQEKWMKAHEGRINGVMMGVGAGFDFHAGTIKRAPVWIQKAGFEWLYRLFQDPKRLISRYFITNIKFFYYLATDIVKGRVGK